MPQVPYRPVPEQTLSLVPTPKVSVNTPDAAFGGAEAQGKIVAAQGAEAEAGAQRLIAQSRGLIAGEQGAVANAWVHLGQVTSHAGDELFKRALAMQDLINRADADNLTTQYAKQAGEKHAAFSSLEGKAAAAALPAYYKDLEETRTGLKGSSPNPMVQRLFDTESRNIMTRSMFNGAGHAATETKKYVHGELIGKRDAAFEQIYQNPKDPSALGDGYRVLKESITQEAEMGGKGEDWTKMQLAKGVSSITALRIKSVARYEPFKAEQMLEANKGSMHREDVEAVENAIRTNSRAVESVNIANEVYSKDKTLAQMQEEAKSIAEKRSKDPLMPKRTVDAVDAIFSQNKRADREQQVSDMQSFKGAVRNQDGSTVRNEQELLAKPGMQEVISRLPKSVQNDIPGYINRTNAAVNKVSNSEARLRVGGMYNNPDSRATFLDLDMSKQGLSADDQFKFEKLQAKTKEKFSGDPRVMHAAKLIGDNRATEAENLGVRRYKEANKDDYNHYLGAISAALDVWPDTHGGKKPTDKEIIEDIAPQVFKQQQGQPGFIYSNIPAVEKWLRGSKPLFKTDVPDKWLENQKQEMLSKGIDPTEVEQVDPGQWHKLYMRDMLLRHYDKGKAK